MKQPGLWVYIFTTEWKSLLKWAWDGGINRTDKSGILLESLQQVPERQYSIFVYGGKVSPNSLNPFFSLIKKNYEHCKCCLKIGLHTLLLCFYFSTVLFPDNVWIGKYPHRSSQALSRVAHLYFTWDIHTDILTTIKAHFSILYKLVIMTPSMIAWLAQLLPYGRNCDYFLEYCNYLKQTF